MAKFNPNIIADPATLTPYLNEKGVEKPYIDIKTCLSVTDYTTLYKMAKQLDLSLAETIRYLIRNGGGVTEHG